MKQLLQVLQSGAVGVSTRGDMMDQASLVTEVERGVHLAAIRTRAERDAEIIARRKELGTYGRCDDCEEEIAKARLDAVPAAVRCKECEEKHEVANPVSRQFGFVGKRKNAH